MKTLIEYLAFIENQTKLTERAEEVINFISKLYPKKYGIYQYIEQINFSADEVMVISEETFRGSSDTDWTDFPSSWLFLPNAEIEIIVLAQKADDEKQQAEKEAKAQSDKKTQKEQQDRDLYESLKKKFETK
jgi:hypothetical protein